MQSQTHLLDDGQNPWFALIIPVRTNTEVDLLLEGVGLVSGGEFEDRIGRCQRRGMEGRLYICRHRRQGCGLARGGGWIDKDVRTGEERR